MSESNGNAGIPAQSSAPEAAKSQESNQNIENVEASGEESGEQAPLTAAEKKKLKQLEIKYNGKAEKVDLPFEIDEEHADFMRKQMQMAKMAQVKAQEAAGWEREVASFLHQLQENPRKALSDPRYGVDLKKVAAEILQEEFERSQKSPEQLAQEEAAEERRKFLEEKKQWEDEKKSKERQAVIDQAAQHYDNAMSKALETYSIPKTPLALHKMAHYMSLEIQRGFEPDMDIIAQKVEDDMSSDYREMLKAMSHDKRLKLLGEEIFEEDRKARVAKIKKAPPTAKNVTQDAGKVEPKKENKQKQTFRQRFGV
jgi:hypothetical protein